MSVDQVLQTIQGAAYGADRTLHVDSDAEFRRTLTVGQIIKGRVLQHYEGSRYLVDFSGQRRVVDSRMMLLEGAALSGRVTSLADKVVLQRVIDSDVQSFTKRDGNIALKADSGFAQIEQWLVMSGIEISTAERTVMLKILRESRNRTLTLLASMLVIKTRLKFYESSVIFAEKALTEERLKVPDEILERAIVVFEMCEYKTTLPDKVIPLLTAYLQAALISQWKVDLDSIRKDDLKALRSTSTDALKSEDPQDKVEDTPVHEQAKDRGQDAVFPAPTWLMNTQVDGTVAHRIATLPLWVGGRLTEFDVALFSQQEHSKANQSSSRYQKVMLALETETLGSVNVVAHLINDHLKLSITSMDKNAAAVLSQYSNDLQKQLNGASWVVDEISYQEYSGSKGESPIMTVAEHIISKDSFSRMI
ncbi:MAG: flagellar hook-length control protein FliK [Candidatus Sedimenticola sp. (ex Thyasira tokunagai)]